MNFKELELIYPLPGLRNKKITSSSVAYHMLL